MSSTLFKANRINIKSEGKKVIDSNDTVAQRIRMLNELLEQQQADAGDDFGDGFVEGLDAAQVEMLLADPSEGMDGEFVEGFSDAPSIDMSQALAGANTQIEQMLADAKMQAEEIVNAAHAEAETILSSANADSLQIREQASEEGFQEGFERGHAEGLARISEMEEELNMRSEAMTREYEEQLDALEPLFIENLTDIYSHVFNVDLSSNTQIIIHLIKNAIRNIDGTKSYFVHVSQDDYQQVLEGKEELLVGLGSQVSLEVIMDITLKKAECFIEAESGIFDCSLGTELELLKKELILLSYQKEN